LIHYKVVKDRFEATRKDYDVNIPDMDVVLGESEPGKPGVFMIVDKIGGKDEENWKEAIRQLNAAAVASS